ncbi:hypothetical protein [Xanthobacter aminoxidans]|uniref:hypothetical protein n=1 Tax=Xanthobacter aminoxidans TaxID=186280 RepID=UPI002022BCD7|nr:hypothetical protein [Xanthobacter aminoxidans]MCL8385278.1 hypothetical protein [Xanthobacter aminoxidans]
MPTQRAVNNHGDGTLFDRAAFAYDAASDSLACPAGRRLVRKQLNRKERAIVYASPDCAGCALKPGCTTAARRIVTRHLDEDAIARMDARATPQRMRARRRRTSLRHPQENDRRRTLPHPKPQGHPHRDGPLGPRLQRPARNKHPKGRSLKRKKGPGKCRSLSLFPHSLSGRPFFFFSACGGGQVSLFRPNYQLAAAHRVKAFPILRANRSATWTWGLSQ